ncbi:uncharacterized protein [Miscanthus floridulus]|uniref:uncharacterized protein n=1 Tax=Miscanthus floridulus TaxID=154761 RepID=UPI003459C2C9
MLEVLNQAKGVLRDVIVPTGWARGVPTSSSLIARSREKYGFLHEQKEKWDCLIEEARLPGDVSAQLAVAQQRVAELTPLAKEAADLRQREAEAHRNAEDAEKVFQDLSMRARQDEEEGARVRKERGELLQRDTEARQWVLDLLAEVEKERELKLGAEERSMTLQQRASLDTEAIARLCKERDELHQTAERLRSEHGAARGEHDQAV